jgi:hypothetical protein
MIKMMMINKNPRVNWSEKGVRNEHKHAKTQTNFGSIPHSAATIGLIILCLVPEVGEWDNQEGKEQDCTVKSFVSKKNKNSKY